MELGIKLPKTKALVQLEYSAKNIAPSPLRGMGCRDEVLHGGGETLDCRGTLCPLSTSQKRYRCTIKAPPAPPVHPSSWHHVTLQRSGQAPCRLKKQGWSTRPRLPLRNQPIIGGAPELGCGWCGRSSCVEAIGREGYANQTLHGMGAAEDSIDIERGLSAMGRGLLGRSSSTEGPYQGWSPG